jgi:error-prone DNA polymerase
VIELGVRSHFSFLRGASSPEALVARAKELGHQAIGLADVGGLYGQVRAHEEAEKQEVKLIVGAEIPLAGVRQPVLLFVADFTGYQNLCALLTSAHADARKGKARKHEPGTGRRFLHADAEARNAYIVGVSPDELCTRAEGLWLVAPDPSVPLGPLRDAFRGRASLAAWRHKDGEDRRRHDAVCAAAERFGLPVSATNQVRYARREDKPLHDVLHCIREGTTLSAAGRSLAPNAEACLKSPEEMARLFADRPAWLARSDEIGAGCHFSLGELRYRFPCTVAEPGETLDESLRRLTSAGARVRYPAGLPAKVAAQVEKELALIARLEVAPFFLSVYEIVQIARARDILCQGRGSAANSAVCYCLGITAVDPARSSLLFERFLSAERREPPDIDLDIEHERREEVIQEIYARYGRDRAAMVSEVICYRGKSALREVGKVFGLATLEIDRLATLIGWWDGLSALSDKRLVEVGLDPADPRLRQTLALSAALQGTPRHLSIHVGGFVLSAEPLTRIAPVEPATMPGRTVIPWDKDDIDTLGFFKVDCLGLGMLTAIRKALVLVDPSPGRVIDKLAAIPAEDPVVYDALCQADTVGVFQVESRAQMAMLPRLRPRRFYDLVVEVAIVRPGPIQGGMVHPYLRRRQGLEAVGMPHPLLAPILERTLGVPIFQEQVMQIAITGAGYTGGEADQLRRDMAAWRKNGHLERHRGRLLEGFAARGIPAEFGEALYQQIQGFAEYGFPESHAASFALLVYASAWLKVHHPAAFAAALVNSQPMGFYSPSTILSDAARHGVSVLPACVQASGWDCRLVGGAIRLGLRLVKGLGEESGRRIEAAAPFTGVEDLAGRAGLDRGELEVLAAGGALAALTPGRREAMWQVHAPRPQPLWRGVDDPEPPPSLPPLGRLERIALDFATTGLTLGDHPMQALRHRLPPRTLSAEEIQKQPHGAWVRTAGLVICRQRPGTASGVVFITLEDETGFLNAILYAHVFERLRTVLLSSPLLLFEGRIERDGPVVYVILRTAKRLDPHAEDLETHTRRASRDFH